MKLNKTLLKEYVKEVLNEGRRGGVGISHSETSNRDREYFRLKRDFEAETDPKKKEKMLARMKTLSPASFKEAEIPKGAYLDDPEHISNVSTLRSYEAPSGPSPEDFGEMGLMDIADYFHKVADDMHARIDQLKSMKMDYEPSMSDENTEAALKDMADVQKELQDISRSLGEVLKGLQK